jgi:hypothetical protein
MPYKGRGPTGTPTRPYERPLNRPASACLKCGCRECWTDRCFKTHCTRCRPPSLRHYPIGYGRTPARSIR